MRCNGGICAGQVGQGVDAVQREAVALLYEIFCRSPF